jgi:RNA polymerase sigma factor (sigma-70 family)
MLNAFYTYTNELGLDKYKPLEPKVERALILEYSTGSQCAFEKLVKAHLRFVVWMLREYKIPKDVDIMDVIQEANLGLIEGIKRFKPKDYKCRVYTYCFYWIRFYIMKSLSSTSRIHKIFVPIPEDAEYVENEEEVIRNDTYYEQTAIDIVQHALGDLEEKERKILILFFGLVSPYEPKTLQEIGSMLHINSLEKVRQIKDSALKKLKKDDLNSLL